MTKPVFGLHLPSYTFPDTPPEGIFPRIAELAAAADEAGFGLVTVMDHLYQIPVVGAETEPMLEAYVTLGALATRTRSVRLATMVSGVTYRNPAFLAKQVTTLDAISGGRAILGLGAAWNEAEHRGYGFEFPPIRERMDRLDEALSICRAMFAEERPSFDGAHYRVERVLNAPRPVRPGGPPIMVGGIGEQRTLRIAAKHADIVHWFALPLDQLRHKTEVLERHGEAVGRDVSEIRRYIASPVVVVADDRDAEAVLARLPPERRAQVRAVRPEPAAEILRPYLDAGFSGFTFNNTVMPTVEAVGLGGELLSLLD